MSGRMQCLHIGLLYQFWEQSKTIFLTSPNKSSNFLSINEYGIKICVIFAVLK